MSLTLKRTIFIFALTTLLGTVLSIILDLFNPIYKTDFVILLILLVIISFAIPNTVLLLLLYKLKIGQDFFLKNSYLLSEIIILFFIQQGLDIFGKSLPDKYRFDYSPGQMSVKIYLQDGFILLYGYILIFFLILIVDKIKTGRLTKT